MKQPKGDWTDLFLTFRLSLDPRKLWLALQGVVASLVLIGLVLGVAASVYHAHGASFAADTDVWGSLVHGRIQPAARETIVFGHRLFGAAPVPQPPDGAMTPVDSVLASGQLTAGIVTGLLILLGMLLVWSHFGVPLMRLAAVEYATGERIELKSATAYGKREHHKFYGAVLGLLAVVVLIGLGSLVAGFVAVNVLAVAILVVGATGAAFVVSKMRSAGRPLLISGGAGVAVLVLAVVLCAVVAHKGWRVPYVGEVLLGRRRRDAQDRIVRGTVLIGAPARILPEALLEATGRIFGRRALGGNQRYGDDVVVERLDEFRIVVLHALDDLVPPARPQGQRGLLAVPPVRLPAQDPPDVIVIDAPFADRHAIRLFVSDRPQDAFSAVHAGSPLSTPPCLFLRRLARARTAITPIAPRLSRSG